MKSFESLRDFREVKDVYLQEKLTEEEKKEGIEPYSDLFKVAITNHAYKRMNDELNRFCDWEEVYELFLQKSNEIIYAPQNEEFILLRKDLKLAVVCVIKNIDGFATIVVKTVIRKVFFDSLGQEREKKVFVNKDKDKVY